MTLIKTCYKTHNSELLAIVKSFKIWMYYVEGFKNEAFSVTNNNNLRQCINMKSLSSCQVRWAQKLSYYPFQIDYYQDKVNRAIIVLPRFFERRFYKEKKLWAENTQILYCL